MVVLVEIERLTFLGDNVDAPGGCQELRCGKEKRKEKNDSKTAAEVVHSLPLLHHEQLSLNSLSKTHLVMGNSQSYEEVAAGAEGMVSRR